MNYIQFQMKKFLVLSIAAILSLAYSCNSENKEEIPEDMTTSDITAGEEILPLIKEEYPQEWKLISMSGMMQNSGTSGEDMDYQETYRFLPDKTFSKIRIKNNSSTEASGTFSIIRTGGGEEFFKLSYPEENELIENCTGGREELLIIDQEKTLRGTANACDHLSKTYRQI